MTQHASGTPSRTLAWVLLCTLVAFAGCAAPCTDDGLVWKQDGPECQQQPGASATESSTGSASATVTQGTMSGPTEGSASASVSASATEGSASMSASESATDAITDGSASVTETANDGGGGACENGVKDPDETDVDCGGACGSSCEIGELCVDDVDCVTLTCDGTACVPDPACVDGMQSPGETDVDCGGPCGPSCEVDEGCGNNTDCVSIFCAADMTCDQPACDDGEQNGDETDVDCGGSCGPTCDNGEHCLGDPDCVDDYCNPLEVCSPQECVLTEDDNQCQACIKTSCCDSVTACLLDPKCACWLECIQQNNDFAPCTETCNIKGKPGPITACANSQCNTPEACDLQ